MAFFGYIAIITIISNVLPADKNVLFIETDSNIIPLTHKYIHKYSCFPTWKELWWRQWRGKVRWWQLRPAWWRWHIAALWPPAKGPPSMSQNSWEGGCPSRQPVRRLIASFLYPTSRVSTWVSFDLLSQRLGPTNSKVLSVQKWLILI